MKFAGMLRVKNEARWIQRVISSLLPLCERVYVLDDHSSDGTPELAAAFSSVKLFPSPFEGLDESRDKNWLLDRIREDWPDFVVAIDGDEELERGGQDKIRRAVLAGDAWTFQVLYLWNSDTIIRTDGVYGRMCRPSMFRLASADRFRTTNHGANLHCSSVPGCLIHRSIGTGIRLLHYGYRDREDRIRKYHWYNTVDPGSALEDQYRHVVQGDVPEVPAAAKLMHAGPLTLKSLPQWSKGNAA
jgi:glycosyltransferase involved in cell wall biosynthesis